MGASVRKPDVGNMTEDEAVEWLEQRFREQLLEMLGAGPTIPAEPITTRQGMEQCDS